MQFQLTIPALQTEATATASLKRSDSMTLQLETAVKIPETTSLQRITFKLGISFCFPDVPKNRKHTDIKMITK